MSQTNSYTVNIQSGYNLIANQLNQGSNTLSEIMPSVPDGCAVYKYDNAGGAWTGAYFFAGLGGWTPTNLTLNPGEGAFFESPTNFSLGFSGELSQPVLPVTVSNGVAFLLSCQTTNLGYYTNIIGAPPANGAQWYQWSSASAAYTMFTFSNSLWMPSEPTAAVGEAVWIAPGGGGPPTTHPPIITQQPTNTQVMPGASAIFSVVALGGPTLTYQWYYYSVPIAGANGPTLVLTNASPTNAGFYWVKLINVVGEIISQDAQLGLVDSTPPAIQCPSNVVAHCSSPLGTVVTYSPVATDSLWPNVTVTCIPPSGSVFAPGVTTVNCLAFNGSGVSNSCSFTVTVLQSAGTNGPPNPIVVYLSGTNAAGPPSGLDDYNFTPILSTNGLVWTTDEFGQFLGQGHIALPGASGPNAGLLFGAANEPSLNSHAIAAVPDGNGWDITVRSSVNPPTAPLDQGDVPTSSPENLALQFLYVPWTTPSLIAGVFDGTVGVASNSAGNFTLIRTGEGQYALTIPGVTGIDGNLLLSVMRQGFPDTNTADNIVLSEVFTNGQFLIQSQVAIPGDGGFVLGGNPQDTVFAFAWSPFLSQNSPPNPATPRPTALLVAPLSRSSIQLTWLASASQAGFILESTTNLATGGWSPVGGTPQLVTNLNWPNTYAQTVTLSNLTRYFRLFSYSSTYPGCQNGDFENGDFSNWQGTTSLNTGGIPNGLTAITTVTLPDPGRLTLTSTANGNDPFGGFPEVDSGNYAAKLGSTAANQKAETLQFTFVVNNLNKFFNFEYAVVLQDPGHAPAAQPYFMVRMYLGSTYLFSKLLPQVCPNLPGNAFPVYVVSDHNNPYFTVKQDPNYGTVVYKPWDCVACALGDGYIGQTVSIDFTAAGCQLGGHFGYAYIDGICTPTNQSLAASFTMPSQICLGQGLIADGSASFGEVRYFWSVVPSNPYYGIDGTALGEGFIGQAGPIDIKSFYTKLGGVWQCGHYYLVKLAVQNGCDPWVETNHLVYIDCPAANAGPDQHICCSSPTPVQIGTPLPAGYSCSWSSYPPGFSSTSPINTVQPNCTTKYTVTVTDPEGCTGTSSAVVYVDQPFTVSLSSTVVISGDPCRPGGLMYQLTPILTPVGCTNNAGCPPIPGLEPDYFYSWSTGQTNSTILVPPGTNTYYLTVSNACGSATAQISYLPELSFFGSAPPNLYIPNVFTPCANVNTVWFVKDTSLPVGASPAYGAVEYELIIFDRWGVKESKRQTVSSATGFVNGVISWDGKNASGVLQSDGVYYYSLFIRNCNGWFGNAVPTGIPMNDRFTGWKTGNIQILGCPQVGGPLEQTLHAALLLLLVLILRPIVRRMAFRKAAR